MKVVKKIFIILIFLLLGVSVISYLDYYLVKKSNSLPRIAIKNENKEKEMIVFSALFYKVWHCTADGTNIIGDYKDKEPVCTISYKFEDGYYTNISKYKIPKRSLLLMVNNNIYTHEMIDIMSTDEEIENAVFVSETYGKTFPKAIENKKATIINKSEEYSLVVFPEFLENEEKDTYEWVYNTNDVNNYYCVRLSDSKKYEYSKYIDGYCENIFKPITMSEKWCKLYQNSTLVYNEELTKKLCEE